MADQDSLRNVVVVGASGNVGTSLLEHLLQAESGRFNITAVSRSDSKATFPDHPSLKVKKGSYTDPAFLQDAFGGQDAVVFALGFMAMEAQKTMIEVAAKAGVKWILPTEYAGDGMNEEMVNAVPVFHPKRAARQEVERLSQQPGCEGLKWIGIATNPWLEASLQRGLFGINPSARTATLYADSGSYNTSTIDLVGMGMARILSLPISDSSNPRASLQHYANNFVYLSSFLITQGQLVETIQRVTKTSDADWSIDRSKTIKQWISESRDAMSKGNMMAGLGLTFAVYMGEGMGGDYEAKAKEDRQVLRLPEESLEKVVKKAVEGEQAAPLFPPKAE